MMTAKVLATIAHISDLHLPIPGLLPPRHWTVKRGLGYINWHRRRKRRFRRETVDSLTADLLSQQVDHIAVTGDLANIGLPVELEVGLEWLKGLGAPDRVTVVPGNHDLYVPLRSDPGVGRWSAYMTSDALGLELADKLRLDASTEAVAFPFVRRVGPSVALIGLNSSRPMPFYSAQGEMGRGQLQRLEKVLAKLREMHLMRVVLIHHPPLSHQARPLRALRDGDALGAVLRRTGAELILHGHNHTNTLGMATGPDGPVPIVGIAAAGFIAGPRDNKNLARYNLVDLVEEDGHWRAAVRGRGFASTDGGITDLECLDLQLPRPEQADVCLK